MHGQFDPIVRSKSQLFAENSTLLFHNSNDSLFFQCYFDLSESFAFTVLFSCSRKKWHQKRELKKCRQNYLEKKFFFFLFSSSFSRCLLSFTIALSFLTYFLRSLFCCETSFLLSLASLFSYSNNRMFGKFVF